jgi:23S rRNA (cytosine1962-C5)-methyltransferase
MAADRQGPGPIEKPLKQVPLISDSAFSLRRSGVSVPMSKLPRIVLHPGRDKSVRHRHPLVFSGSIEKWPDHDSPLLSVRSHAGDYLGVGHFRAGQSLAGRMLWFSDTPESTSFEDWIEGRIERAVKMRTNLPLDTDAFRLIMGESDGIPGVTLDRYADLLVIQVSSAFMEERKFILLDALIAALAKKNIAISTVLQRPVPAASSEPGTQKQAAWLKGEPTQRHRFMENGLRFWIDFSASQKTGFFLDQRENRSLLERYARGRHVLNCFCYTGASSVYAARGGALRVDSVDVSEGALAVARDNFRDNGLDVSKHGFYEEDVFEYLRKPDIKADIIVLDPPAFARTRKELPQAMRGYRDIHRLAFSRVERGGFVLTSSCSHPVTEDLLQKVIFQAALEAGRNVRILEHHRNAADHPTSIFYPEGGYIKGFLLYVDQP